MDLFGLMARRLEWTGARQGILAQNIANNDTPGYAAQDIQPFADMLKGTGVVLAQTAPGHLAPRGAVAGVIKPRPEEKAPDGNAVSMESELIKIADTGQAQQVTLNLYSKYLGMFRAALGKG
jgi:flagellar basal-body rod protein FlgB